MAIPASTSARQHSPPGWTRALLLMLILLVAPSHGAAQSPPNKAVQTPAPMMTSPIPHSVPNPRPAVSLEGAGYAGGFSFSSSLPVLRYLILVPVVIALLVFWYFIRIFATPLPAEGEHSNAERLAVARMVRFCYGFTLFSFVIVVSPLAMLNALPIDITGSYYVAMAESPVALVLGCVHFANPEDRASELACKEDRLANEWLVNIGGLVLQRLPYSQANPSLTAGVSLAGGIAATAPLGAVDQTTDWVDDHVGTPMYNLPAMTLHEGVTVPFYFILIALFGAAVSLARRVPEIQRRYLSQSDHLDAAGARELLVSQILQFLSAPIIAITAYAVFAPSGPSSSVVLAFVSGFSSDAIIASFKGIADGIISTAKGAGAPPPPPPPNPTLTSSTETLSQASALTSVPRR